MKLLYIHQYFKTPLEAGGTRSYWFAKALLEQGYEVIMLTSRKSQKKIIEIQIIENIQVVYIKNAYDNTMGVFARLMSFLRFMFISTLYAFKLKGIDLVFSTSTPLTVGIPALILKKLKKIPYIFEVRDLWPEFPIQVGAIKNKLVIKILQAYEKSIYNNASHIIALSSGMADGVFRTGINKERVTMIPNMSKNEKFYPRDKNVHLYEQFQIDAMKFKVIHFGSMGIANGLEYILNAAQICQKQNLEVQFIFLGEGKTKQVLIQKSKSGNLDNVLFVDEQPMSIVSDVVNICDLSIVSFMNLPILQTNSPNKLFDSLSAGIPVVVNSAGWTKDLVEKNNCGFFADPEKPEELVKVIEHCLNNRDSLKQLGLNARKLAEKEFSKDILCQRFVDVINSCVKKNA